MSIKIGCSIGWLFHHSHDSFIHFSSDFFYGTSLAYELQDKDWWGMEEKSKCFLFLMYKCWSLWFFHNIKSKKNSVNCLWTIHVIKFKNKQNNLETGFESSCPIWKSSSYPRYPMISTAMSISWLLKKGEQRKTPKKRKRSSCISTFCWGWSPYTTLNQPTQPFTYSSKLS